MKCPNCEHESGAMLLRCTACGEVFEREMLEKLGHLEYLLTWLEEREQRFESEALGLIRSEASREFNAILQGLGLVPSEQAPEAIAPEPLIRRPLEEIAREIDCLESILEHIHAWGKTVFVSVGYEGVAGFRRYILRKAVDLKEQLYGREVKAMPPTDIEAVNFALEMLPTWSEDLRLDPAVTVSFDRYLKQQRAELLMPEEAPPTPVAELEPAVPVVPVEETKVVERPIVEAPPPSEITLPKFDWGKWWERTWTFVTSGAMLRGLLYLGAFMIVVSAAVLVVSFWDLFPEIVQLLFIASVPTIFYLAGWGVRTRLKLPQAGSVLSGIGALLVAVDFAAVYQFGGLAGRVDLTAYWFGASFLCAIIYTISAWRLPTEFFGYITVVGTGSTLLALTELLNLPLEWQVVVIAAFGIGLVEGATRLREWKENWESLSRAGWRSAHVFLLASMAVVLFAPGDAAPGQMTTFLLSTIGFGLLAFHSLQAVYSHAMVWTSIGVFVFLFLWIDLPYEWAGTAAGVLVVLYGFGRETMRRWLEEEAGPWKHVVMALSYVHWVLIILSLVAGGIALTADVWAGVISITLSSILLVWSAMLYHRSSLVLAGAMVFIVPVSLALGQWFIDYKIAQDGAWLMVGWSGLALVYLGLAAALRGIEEYGRWLNLVAHIITPVSLLGLWFNFVLTSDEWTNGPTLVSLGGIIFVYVVSALIHDSDKHPALSKYLDWLPEILKSNIFLWPISLFLPIWMAIAWLGTVLVPSWLGAALCGLGLAYVGLGELLARRKADYRLAPHVFAYLLVATGILVALEDRWALLTTLYLAIAVFAAMAIIYRRVWEIGIGALLFIWPFQLSLELSPLTTHAYALAYALLACIAYIPIGVVLDRADRKFAFPLFGIGYAMALTAVVLSVLGRFDVYEMDVPWLGVVPPLIVVGLMVFSTRYFRAPMFSWAAAVILPIAYDQTLTLFKIPSEYNAVAWVGLATVYMAVERLINRKKAIGEELWHRSFRLPLGVGVVALTAIGLILTISGTFDIFFRVQEQGHLPLIVAQALAVGLVAVATNLYRNRWLLYIGAALSFFPYTLVWMGYGPVLTSAEISWTWMGLSAVLLAIGFVLDRSEERTSHGPYFVGYAMSIFALAWSTQDRHAHLYTFGAFLLLSAISQVIVHRGRHFSFDNLIDFIWRTPGTITQRAARTAFLFVVGIGFPIWLTQLLTYHEVSLAWKGLALALTAPLYIALGLVFERVKPEYTWPFYGVGYILTAIGAMVAFDDPVLAIYVLALDAVVYAVSAIIFRQPFWLYLSTILLPVLVLLILNHNEVLIASWVAPIFMGVAFAYFVLGFVLNRRRGAEREGVDRFALPFFAPGYVLSAVALAVASSEKMLALWIFSSGVVYYALSAWTFREAVFLYPTAWLAAVPYYLGMTLLQIAPDWYGIGWLPLIVGFIAIGRLVFQKGPLGITKSKTFFSGLTHSAMPFYLLAYGLSVSMLYLSRQDPAILAMTLTAGAILYFTSAGLFNHASWLYPGLLVTHFAVGTLYDLIPLQLPSQYLALPFLILTWIIALVGKRFTERRPVVWQTNPGGMLFRVGGREIDFKNVPFLGHLLTPSWAQPFFIFATVDIILWQIVAGGRLDTTILLGVGNAILLGIFATVWRDIELVYGTIALSLVALCARLWWAGMPLADGLAWIGGVGLGLYIVGLILEDFVEKWTDRLAAFRIWLKPLTYTSLFLTGAAVVVTLPQVRVHGVAATSALGFAGVLYLTIAYRGRHIRLSYLGLALLELDWALMLIDQEIKQPQFYAIPAGLYFVFVGFLERRQGRKQFAMVVENFGLAVMIVTSFIQSLNGEQGFPYFLLLLVEGLLVIWWGVAQQRKIPFFIGVGASVLNVVSQVVVLINVYDVQRWIIMLGVGVLLVTAAIFVERQRERIIARMQEWRKVLETWE